MYRTPIDICVRSFLDAILIFTQNITDSPRLRDIHLVNRDADVTVTSIVLLQTLLVSNIDSLTAEALLSIKQTPRGNSGTSKSSNTFKPCNRPSTAKSLNQLDKLSKEKIELCGICLDKVKRPNLLMKCKHRFCTPCKEKHFSRSKPSCPICRTIHGVIQGNQPKSGSMTYITKKAMILPGHESEDGTIIIYYTFPNGVQEVSVD